MPTFKVLLAWPIGPGGVLRSSQGQRVNVYDAGTSNVPAGLTQGGQAVQWVTSDAAGAAEFTTGSANVVDLATPDGTFTRRIESQEQVGAGGGAADGPPPGVAIPVGWWVAPFDLSGTKIGKTIASTRASYIVVPSQITVDQVGIQVTTAEAAKSAKMLVYSSTPDGLPASLVINQTLSLATLGSVTGTLGAAVVLAPGIYWGFLVTDGTTAEVECASQDVLQSVADTFNRVRNSTHEWWSASPGTFAAPAATIASYTWSSYGANSNRAPIWAMRRSA